MAINYMVFLQYFGVVFFDSRNDWNAFQIAYSFVLFVTCACNLIWIPIVAPECDDWLKALSSSMSVITCSMMTVFAAVSRIIVTYKVCKYKHYQKYKTTLEGFEIYMPKTAEAVHHIVCFSFTVVSLCMLLILPANGVKLYNISHKHRNRPVLMTTYFLFYYIHNLSMCCTELHFVIQCFVVYTKFRDINDGLRALNDEQKTARYGLQHATTTCREADLSSQPQSPVLYESDFYRPRVDRAASAVANAIELLKLKHWLTREAVYDIKLLFGVRICLSIIQLITETLFDVYTEVFYSYSSPMFGEEVFRSRVLFATWMLQYSLRFCMIVVTMHTTTQQAFRTKAVVAEMSNRCLDKASKEELQLFYNQLAICTTEFSVCGIFTLKNSLILSVLAGGATYILILAQFQ